MVDKYDAFEDRPWNHTDFYKELDKYSPNSKFILTIRDVNNWISSYERWGKKVSLKNKWYYNMVSNECYGVDDFLSNKEIMKKKYEERNQEIIEYFKDTNKLFVMDIEKNSEWGGLCKFLNNNPSKDNLNKLYDTTIYFAESDSIGEGWHYVREFTRESFDILCKIMKIDNLDNILINLSEDKNKAEEKLLNDKIVEFTKKYKNRKNISELIKKYRKQLEKDKKHFTYYTELQPYLIDNNILNEKEIPLYKKLSGELADYITISFELLHHLRIL